MNLLLRGRITQMVHGWTIVRALRLVAGLVLVYEGTHTGDWAIGSVGAFLVLLSWLNAGCGVGSGRCEI